MNNFNHICPLCAKSYHDDSLLILLSKSHTSFLIRGIRWFAEDRTLPSQVHLNVPDSLVALGAEDFEPDDKTDDFTDDDWDDYEPSNEAHVALQAHWHSEISNLLEAEYGCPVCSIEGFEPA